MPLICKLLLRKQRRPHLICRLAHGIKSWALKQLAGDMSSSPNSQSTVPCVTKNSLPFQVTACRIKAGPSTSYHQFAILCLQEFRRALNIKARHACHGPPVTRCRAASRSLFHHNRSAPPPCKAAGRCKAYCRSCTNLQFSPGPRANPQPSPQLSDQEIWLTFRAMKEPVCRSEWHGQKQVLGSTHPPTHPPTHHHHYNHSQALTSRLKDPTAQSDLSAS